MRSSPHLCKPRIMRRIPPINPAYPIQLVKALPIKLATMPSPITVVENPSTKDKLCFVINHFRLRAAETSAAVPLRYPMYAGSTLRSQGAQNDIAPATAENAKIAIFIKNHLHTRVSFACYVVKPGIEFVRFVRPLSIPLASSAQYQRRSLDVGQMFQIRNQDLKRSSEQVHTSMHSRHSR